MLYYNTINSATLELLRQLQAIPAFSKLRLVGETSLALQIGHRTSIDLDLFGCLAVDEFAITRALNELGDVTILKKSENINIYTINGIKVDIVNYPYSWLLDTLAEDNLKLARIEDIAAMKLAAITTRGTKKDFIDLFFLLKQYSLAELLEFYNKKYADGTIFLVVRSLSYFDDADTEAMPNMSTPINWQEVKDHINRLLNNYLKNC